MEGRGLLLRTHGGAVLAEDGPAVVGFGEKSGQALREKEVIARKALGLIRSGQNILLDAGTTCLALARLIRHSDLELQVITNSLAAASVLAGSESVGMVVLGGSYRGVTSAIIGDSAVEQLKRFNVDVAFLGASGATPEGGFSCQNLHEAQIKRAMLQQAALRVVLIDSSKFGSNKFAAFGGYGDVNCVVSDDLLAEDQRRSLEGSGIKVL